MTTAINDKHVVSIHYKLTNDEGAVLDTSEGEAPLDYLHGAGNIVPGLEHALTGKTEGDKVQVRIEPKDGYGEVNEELVQNVDRELFKSLDKLEPGMELAAESPDGSVRHIRVQSVSEETVTIDANHPLAGVTLNFDVEVMGVRQATETEVDHGHVH